MLFPRYAEQQQASINHLSSPTVETIRRLAKRLLFCTLLFPCLSSHDSPIQSFPRPLLPSSSRVSHELTDEQKDLLRQDIQLLLDAPENPKIIALLRTFLLSETLPSLRKEKVPDFSERLAGCCVNISGALENPDQQKAYLSLLCAIQNNHLPFIIDHYEQAHKRNQSESQKTKPPFSRSPNIFQRIVALAPAIHPEKAAVNFAKKHPRKIRDAAKIAYGRLARQTIAHHLTRKN